MIFTAHSHYSRLITYPPQQVENLVDNRVVTIALNNIVQNFTEITAPTCSYRMGMLNVGYGHAVIGKCEKIIKQFKMTSNKSFGTICLINLLCLYVKLMSNSHVNNARFSMIEFGCLHGKSISKVS